MVNHVYSQFGKQPYTIITQPDAEWEYSYSANKLETELSKNFKGQKLKSVYIALSGYLGSLYSTADCIDLSCIGGTALIIFDKLALQLAIHAEGMVEYRIFPVRDIKMKAVYDYPTENALMAGNGYFNLQDSSVSLEYAEKRVESVSVEGTGLWSGFYLPGFDEEAAELAARENDLPSEIQFRAETGVIRFEGDSIEYYRLYFKPLK